MPAEAHKRCSGKAYRGLAGWLMAVCLALGTAAAQADPPSFASVLAGMQKRWTTTVDYRCRFETRSTNGEASRDVVLAYFYRHPAQIRMEVLEGPYAGSLLLYNQAVAPRQVRVLAGNPLVAFLQRMLYGEFFAVDHKWMVDLRGNGIHESDWAHFIASHRQYVDQGTSRFVGEEMLDGRQTYRYQLRLDAPGSEATIQEEHVWVDAQTYFPVQYVQYDAAGRLARQARVSELQFNTGLDANLFVDFHPGDD